MTEVWTAGLLAAGLVGLVFGPMYERVLLTFRIFAGRQEEDSRTETAEDSQRSQRRRRSRRMMPGFFLCGFCEASVVSGLRSSFWLRPQGRAVKKSQRRFNRETQRHGARNPNGHKTTKAFHFRTAVLLCASLSLCLIPHRFYAGDDAGAGSLKLLISIEQQTITMPFPARITLHIHNAGPEPVWLYRHARDAVIMARTEGTQTDSGDENGGYRTHGGSTLAIHLTPVGSGALATEAAGVVLENVGLPHPTLVRVGPAEDYEEKAVVHVAPASTGAAEAARPVWGHYRLSATYGASYSNGDETVRNLGVRLWQGEAESNTIDIDLEPAATADAGSVTGTVVSPDAKPVPYTALVSLSDRQERLVDQTRADLDGRFSFSHLPLGLYWVTARPMAEVTDSAMFQHVELTSAEPKGGLRLVMVQPEIYEAKQMLHKPVLIRVTDSAG